MAEKLYRVPDKPKNETKEDGSKTDVVKEKQDSPKGSKKKLSKTKKAQEREFDWPKKNYFEVSCVAAESSGSGQRMVNSVGWLTDQEL